MRCRSSVEDPRAIALLRHLVEGGDETRLVPCAHHGRAWCRVAGGRWRRSRHLRRRKGGVSLREVRHGRAPLLLWAPGPWVEADPWAGGLGSAARSSLGTLARLLLLLLAAAAAATVAAAAVAAFALALASAAAAGLRSRRGRRAAGRRGAGCHRGGSKGSVGSDLVVVGEAKFLQAKHVRCLGEGR